MKTTLKVLAVILCAVLLVISLLHFALVYILPLDDVKSKITRLIKEKTGADVTIGRISANLFDLKLENVGVESNGEFLFASDRAYVYFAPLFLLKGKIKVMGIDFDGIKINITKDKTGRFNFENLIANTETAQTTPDEQDEKETKKLIKMLFCKTNIQNASVRYRDLKNKTDIKIDGISFYVENFSFDSPFKFNAALKTDVVLKDKKLNGIYTAFNSTLNLNDLNLEKAGINISNFVIKYQDASVVLKGTVENFNNPLITADISINNLSSESFKNITEMPVFFIPYINIRSKLSADLIKSIVNIESFSLKTEKSFINASGFFNYGGKEPVYYLKTDSDISLKEIGGFIDMLKPYKINGTFKSDIETTDKNPLKGICRFINAGFVSANTGVFTDINSEIGIENLKNIKIPKLNGNLNDNPFTANASYVITKNAGDVSFFFRADKITYRQIEPDNSIKQQQETAPAPDKKTTEQKQLETKKEQSTPLNIKIDFAVKDLDTIFFKGQNIVFNTNILGFTPVMDAVNGSMNFQTEKGTIKDLYKLTNANMLTKSLFLSLFVVSKVINALNVIEILDNIGKSVFSSEKKEEAQTDESQKKMDGKIDFDSFTTKIKVTDGIANFEKCSFVSSLLSFKITGNINFKDNDINLKVHTAPGRHEDDGIMPLMIKIKGTVDNPQGSLSLLGSVSSIVSQSLLNNVVADGFKKGFSSLLGLKKHDENDNEIQEPEISTNTVTVSQQPE